MTTAQWRHLGALFAAFVLTYALLTFIVGISSVLARVAS